MVTARTFELKPVEPAKSRCLSVSDVPWDSYEMIGAAFFNRSNLRITYDRGSLEIMTLSPEHERLRYFFARMVEIITEERGVDHFPFGSTTYKHEQYDRGIEPDHCYYLYDLERVQDLLRIDLNKDPVPDFAIEIDITHSSIDRMGIYAKLGIPELWRWDGANLLAYRLQSDGNYLEFQVSSLFIPDFPVAELNPFVDLALSISSHQFTRKFRAWLKQYLADRGLAS